MLRLVEGYTHLYRCTETNRIINLNDFYPFEVTANMRGKRQSDSVVLADNERWIMQHWSVVLHPWVEVIPPSITVSLEVQNRELVRNMPLFRVAEPLKRSADSDLEKRLARIEAHMGLVADGRTDGGKLDMEYVPCACTLRAELDGSADDLGSLFEHTQHFLLCVRGLRSFRNC